MIVLIEIAIQNRKLYEKPAFIRTDTKMFSFLKNKRDVMLYEYIEHCAHESCFSLVYVFLRRKENVSSIL